MKCSLGAVSLMGTKHKTVPYIQKNYKNVKIVSKIYLSLKEETKDNRRVC